MLEHRALWLTLIGGGLATVIACMACPPAGAQTQSAPPPAATPSPPAVAEPSAPTEAPQAVIERACQACHDLGVITQGSHTADEWPVILQRMKANGANVTDAEFKAVQEYLIKNYSVTQ